MKLKLFYIVILIQSLALPSALANNESGGTIGDIGKNVAGSGSDILNAILTWSSIIAVVIAISGLLILISKNQQSQAEKKYAWGMILGGGALSGVMFLLAMSQNTLFGSSVTAENVGSVLEQRTTTQ